MCICGWVTIHIVLRYKKVVEEKGQFSFYEFRHKKGIAAGELKRIQVGVVGTMVESAQIPLFAGSAYVAAPDVCAATDDGGHAVLEFNSVKCWTGV
jgi:hypothetical protein